MAKRRISGCSGHPIKAVNNLFKSKLININQQWNPVKEATTNWRNLFIDSFNSAEDISTCTAKPECFAISCVDGPWQNIETWELAIRNEILLQLPMKSLEKNGKIISNIDARAFVIHLRSYNSVLTLVFTFDLLWKLTIFFLWFLWPTSSARQYIITKF